MRTHPRFILVAFATIALAACDFVTAAGYACNDQQTCPNGYTCDSTGHCSANELAPFDGGQPSDSGAADSGPPDAAATDAGPNDAGGGTDSGPMDGGYCAGGTDASVPDASGPMVFIPGGTFTMGSEEVLDGGGYVLSDTRPLTVVTLAPYWLDRTEVTTGAYASWCAPHDGGACVPDTASYCNWGVTGKESDPINCVDWFQAQAYCEAMDGGRLPTEAEWEFAASGPEGRKYPWGDVDPDGTRGNWRNNPGHTLPVGSFPAGRTPSGLDDMAGNVWEWVSDAYAAYPGGSQCHWVQQTGQGHVDRGSAWNNSEVEWMRSANRNYDVATNRQPTIGFRCARDAPP